MHRLKSASILAILLIIFAAVTPGMAETGILTKSSRGIKATLKVTPEKSMVDLYLYNYAKTLTPIKTAGVKASVTLPDGKKVEKELQGMEMDGAFSYMNTLDFSLKGRYIFDISVKTGGGIVVFNFVYDRK